MLCRLYGSVVQMLPACLCCHECCNTVLMQNYMILHTGMPCHALWMPTHARQCHA